MQRQLSSLYIQAITLKQNYSQLTGCPATLQKRSMWTSSTPFAPPGNQQELEQGLVLMPKFDSNGLITAVVTDHGTGEVLMLAHMNSEALSRSIATGDAWYYSRSRHSLWRKGESSGNTQKIMEMRVDCDQDAIWIRVEQTGPACHTLHRSCFYRVVSPSANGPRLSLRQEPSAGS